MNICGNPLFYFRLADIMSFLLFVFVLVFNQLLFVFLRKILINHLLTTINFNNATVIGRPINIKFIEALNVTHKFPSMLLILNAQRERGVKEKKKK